jgi:hypothetical protein
MKHSVMKVSSAPTCADLSRQSVCLLRPMHWLAFSIVLCGVCLQVLGMLLRELCKHCHWISKPVERTPLS